MYPPVQQFETRALLADLARRTPTPEQPTAPPRWQEPRRAVGVAAAKLGVTV